MERGVSPESYAEIGRIYPGERPRQVRFEFEDVMPVPGVAYYRVVQALESGGVRPSAAVKVGLGGAELPGGVGGILLGNFPNPFSATTSIAFEVHEAQHLSVSVWDVSGQQVAMLVDGVVGEGQHEVTFDATDLPSGTYFVRLQTSDALSTRKLIVTR